MIVTLRTPFPSGARPALDLQRAWVLLSRALAALRTGNDGSVGSDERRSCGIQPLRRLRTYGIPGGVRTLSTSIRTDTMWRHTVLVWRWSSHELAT
jgi:hypothetical protein